MNLVCKTPVLGTPQLTFTVNQPTLKASSLNGFASGRNAAAPTVSQGLESYARWRYSETEICLGREAVALDDRAAPYCPELRAPVEGRAFNLSVNWKWGR